MADLWSMIVKPQQKKFRTARAELIKRLVPDIEGANVIDVGGALPFWRAVGHILKPAQVRIFNISAHRTTMFEKKTDDWLTVELYDGIRLPVDDQAADFVICNSVIEHVPPEQRAGLAAEIRRVGRTYIVQTPSPGFPLELHFGLPFVHWLPRKVAREVVVVSPFNLLSDVNVKQYFDQTQLLPVEELKGYFPAARIETEHFLGMPKSNIAIGSG
jgi:hypothetical protein